MAAFDRSFNRKERGSAKCTVLKSGPCAGGADDVWIKLGDNIESDSGGPVVRSSLQTRDRAMKALRIGRRGSRKRKLEAQMMSDSDKRQKRRVREKRRKLAESAKGTRDIANYLRKSSSTANERTNTGNSHGSAHNDGQFGNVGAPETKAAAPCLALNQSIAMMQPSTSKRSVGNDFARVCAEACGGNTATIRNEGDQINIQGINAARLSFVESCKKKAIGGSGANRDCLSTRFLPPCPLQRGVCKAANFMLWPVNVLSPLEQFPHMCATVRCLRESGAGTKCGGLLKARGWTTGNDMPRRIYSLSGDEFVVVRVYRCQHKECGRDTSASNPMFFASLPNCVQQSYQFVLSKKGGVTREFADLLMDSYVSGLPFESLANDRNARARMTYLQTVESFASLCAVTSRRALGSEAKLTERDLRRFGSFGNQTGYAGRMLSPRRLSYLYKALHDSRRDIIDRSLQSTQASGCAASFDDTFKVPKKLKSVGGAPYSCLKTLKGSNGFILWYQISETKGAASALNPLRGVGTRLGKEGGMHTVYSDQCCVDRITFMHAFPFLQETDSSHDQLLPPLQGPSSPVVLVTTCEQIRAALQGLCQSALPSLNSESCDTIALDVEWTAGINSNDGAPGKIGVLQMSTSSVSVVFDLVKILRSSGERNTLPLELVHFLQSSSNAFVGVGVKNDCTYLTQDYGVIVTNKKDLRTIYKNMGFSADARRGSLSHFVSKLLGYSLPTKELGGVRTSDWF